jgi:hypothetical protein
MGKLGLEMIKIVGRAKNNYITERFSGDKTAFDDRIIQCC